MTNKEFNEYVYEQKRQGRSESQIARSLGMSLAHFIGKLNGVDVDKVDPPKTQVKTKPAAQPDRKPADSVKKTEKEDTANLIVDMTMGGATAEELESAVKYSKDVIDSGKKPVDLKKSAKKNHIDELKKQYQKEPIKPEETDMSWMD